MSRAAACMRGLMLARNASQRWVQLPSQRSISTVGEPQLGARDVSFSGSGLLIHFHMGVANVLQARGVIREESQLAGASGGSLVAVLLASGLSAKAGVAILDAVAVEFRTTGTMFKIESGLRRALERVLTQESAARCAGRVQVAVTPASSFSPLQASTPEMISDFRSKEDLIDALVASCFIPGYSARHMTVPLRDKRYLDGAFFVFTPPLPGYVNVCPLKKRWVLPGLLKGVDLKAGWISPDLVAKAPFSLAGSYYRMFQPPSIPEMAAIFECGEEAARAWAAGAPEFPTTSEFPRRRSAEAPKFQSTSFPSDYPRGPPM